MQNKEDKGTNFFPFQKALIIKGMTKFIIWSKRNITAILLKAMNSYSFL